MSDRFPADGMLICGKCHGDGEAECSPCNGLGVQKTYSRIDPDGAGDVPCENECNAGMVDCSECKGFGEVEDE